MALQFGQSVGRSVGSNNKGHGLSRCGGEAAARPSDRAARRGSGSAPAPAQALAANPPAMRAATAGPGQVARVRRRRHSRKASWLVARGVMTSWNMHPVLIRKKQRFLALHVEKAELLRHERQLRLCPAGGPRSALRRMGCRRAPEPCGASGFALDGLVGRTSLALTRTKTFLSAEKSHRSTKQHPGAESLPQRSRFTELGTRSRTRDETSLPA